MQKQMCAENAKCKYTNTWRQKMLTIKENINWAKTESFGFGKLSFFPRRSSCLPPEDQQRKRNSACFWCWSEWQRGDPVITQDMSYEGAIPE